MHLNRLFLHALVAFLAASCSQEEPISRVGVNTVDKAIFSGSWYAGSTVIDVDYEAAGIGTYPGDKAIDYAGGSLGVIPRIRWVIDEDHLYAYRDYQLTAGIDGEVVQPGEILGQPVAAYRIESHFDIRRAYNPVTGEERNVVEENSTDRRWFERQYMRVDWSTNLLPAYFGQTHDLNEVFGRFSREPAEFFVQGNTRFPASWKPQFHAMTCDGSEDTSPDCEDADRPWADDYDKGEIYHISFVNQELLSPEPLTDPRTGEVLSVCYRSESCHVTSIFTRQAYLKVSDSPGRREEGRENYRQYEPVNWTDSRFERHGYFRVEQPTYDRQTSATDPGYRATDFLNYNANRHNLWKKWRDEEGKSIPYGERAVRQVIWHTTPELPAHLVRSSFRVVSNWNEVFMDTVRRVRKEDPAEYPRVACQDRDPDAYCYCQVDPATEELLNADCPGIYDPFETPEQAEARGAKDPYRCSIVVPEGAEPDMADDDVASNLTDASFNGWFDAVFVGDECVQTLQINTCNRASIAENGGSTDGLECEERGDMRFKSLSYVDQPGTSFLGVATLRGDPVTGEILIGDANIGGPALDSYRRRSLETYDILNGNITEEELYTGEDVRAYLSNLNNVQLPAPPRTNFSVGLEHGKADPTILREIQNRMDSALQKAEKLKGPGGEAQTFSHRLSALAGGEIERRLLENVESYAMAGVDELPPGLTESDLTEHVLDKVSPFRRDAHDLLAEYNEVEFRNGRHNVMMPNEYVDHSVQHFVNEHQDWPRARLEFALNRMLYFETQLHELGHCQGLRHDFGGSADNGNYYDDYYLINEGLPLPDPESFDKDATPGLSPDEQLLFEEAYANRRKQRELAGIDRWMNSSVMEYTANWYERTTARAGRYDFAAIGFGYGDIVEIYDNEDERPLSEITPVNTRRIAATYYHGGESCNADTDCPFSEGGARADDLLPINADAGLTQRCVDHPQGESIGGVCSNFDDDVETLAQQSPRYAPVTYRFCSDERAGGGSTAPGTIGWCNRFDEGENYREIVRNVAESYERNYLWSNFRRYRRSFNIGSYVWNTLMGRHLLILQGIYQNLLFQYTADPEFRNQTGAFGFYDEFLATADVMNFYARVLASPNIGAYVWSDRWQRYQRVSGSNADDPGAQLSVPIGLGRYSSSVYQSGLSGIHRIERIGSFYDKLFTIQLLAIRGYVPYYTRDVPFFTNFYDIFPLEMQQVFSGMIRNVPEEYSPRVRCGAGSTFPNCFEPKVLYMDFYRGDCTEGSTTCRPEPQENYASEYVLDGGSSFLLQFYATIYGLSQFPVFFDTTFQNQLFICVEGQGDCFEPTDGAVEGVDYVRFISERYGKKFLAWQVSPSASVENQRSIGFAMIKEADDLSFLLRMISKLRDPGTGDPDPGNLTEDEINRLTDPEGLNYTIPSGADQLNDDESRTYSRVSSLESFFNQLIQLERDFGINSYLGF